MTALSAKTITQLLSVSTRVKPNDDHEKMQFYYHPDHLGSSSSKGNHYSFDTQHREFEVLDKRGKHQGAVNFNGERTKKPNSSGKHNIKIDSSDIWSDNPYLTREARLFLTRSPPLSYCIN